MPTKKDVRSLDARPDRLDLRDREYRPVLKDLPHCYPSEESAFKLFQHYTSSCELILDQGSEGACTGFGLAAVINYLRWKDEFIAVDRQGGQTLNDHLARQCVLKVSERMLYQNARIYDEWEGEEYEGSSCRGAMKGWHRHGVCDEKFWPYRDNKNKVRFVHPKEGWATSAALTPLGSYYRIDADSIVDMQSAIVEVGAIYCSGGTHSGWTNPIKRKRDTNNSFDYLPSITDGLKEDNTGGHAFAIVGYTRDGFIVQNSWGNSWGFQGFAILDYSDWVERGMDAWVVVRGAPTGKRIAPATVVHQSLQDEVVKPDDVEGRRLQSINDSYRYKKNEIKPWTEEKAYQHSIVVGNNGRGVQKLIDAGSPEDCIRRIGYDLPSDWLEKTQASKIVIYAHGGLNSEKASIRRAQIMGPYFLENGIYPIFVCWKSGVMETLSNIIVDRWHDIVTDPRSGGVLDNISEKIREKIDRSIEVSTRRIAGKSLWTEMKQNAILSCDSSIPSASGTGPRTKGAMVNLADALRKHSDTELHLVGHSAGSILLGKWLNVLHAKKLNVETLSLYAPACTVKFANLHFARAVKRGVLSKNNMHFDLLSDEREKADSVGPYKKSLLYLVSRAFEDMHKEPILGLEATWTKDVNGDVYSDRNKHKPTDEQVTRFKVLDKWSSFWKTSPRPRVHTKERSSVAISKDNDTIDLAHGSFDNDIEVVEHTVKRILKDNLILFPIENLGGF